MRCGRWGALAALVLAAPVAAQTAADTTAVVEDAWVTGCVLMDGRPTEIRLRFDSVAGDTVLADERPLADRLARDDGTRYATSAPWFRGDTLVYRRYRFTKWGFPHALPADAVFLDGLRDGVGVYVEPGMGPQPGIIYVPVGRRCVFQPYEFILHQRRLPFAS